MRKYQQYLRSSEALPKSFILDNIITKISFVFNLSKKKNRFNGCVSPRLSLCLYETIYKSKKKKNIYIDIVFKSYIVINDINEHCRYWNLSSSKCILVVLHFHSDNRHFYLTLYIVKLLQSVYCHFLHLGPFSSTLLMMLIIELFSFVFPSCEVHLSTARFTRGEVISCM